MSTVSTVSRVPTASDPALASELSKLPGLDRQVKKTMDQSDFLKLLSSQLANQNPLEPAKDTEMVAQMATFSSVEQMGDLVTSLKSFIVSQDFASTQSMLGKYVTATSEKTSTTSAGATITEKTHTSGLVTSVGYDKDGVSIIKVGDQTFSPADVSAISGSEQSAAEASSGDSAVIDRTQSMLGKYVTVTTQGTRTTAAGTILKVAVDTSGVVTGVGTGANGQATVTVGDKTYDVDAITAIGVSKTATSG